MTRKLADNLDFSARNSLDRPAWASPEHGGLHAYRHKHTIRNGRFELLKDYYVRSRGCR